MLIRKSVHALTFSLGIVLLVYALGAAISLTGQRPVNKQEKPVGVPGIQVSVVNKAMPNSKPVSSVTADSTGAFSFDALPAGTYAVVLNPPAATNAEAKSFFESRSNMRVEVIVKDPKKSGGTNPLVVDFVVKQGMLEKARHDMAKSIIQNIKAREAAPRENEITVEVAKGQSISGRITSNVQQGPH